MANLLNFLLFQIGWFACILGAAHDRTLLGGLLAAGCLVLHLLITTKPKEEIVLLVKGVMIGAAIDTTLLHLSLIVFKAPGPVTLISPPWMLLLWMLLMITINHSLAWLKSRLWVACALGAISGPFCYFAGAQLGAAEIPSPVAFALTMAAIWAVVTPLLFRLAGSPLAGIDGQLQAR